MRPMTALRDSVFAFLIREVGSRVSTPSPGSISVPGPTLLSGVRSDVSRLLLEHHLVNIISRERSSKTPEKLPKVSARKTSLFKVEPTP